MSDLPLKYDKARRTIVPDEARMQSAASPAERYEQRRRCCHTGCRRRAKLEWCGWRWCLRHYWAHKGWGSAGRFPVLMSLGYLLVNLRSTRIIWRIRGDQKGEQSNGLKEIT